MDLYQTLLKAGLTIGYGHWEKDCPCKVCCAYRNPRELRRFPTDVEVVQSSKCAKKACKKYGCECGWE